MTPSGVVASTQPGAQKSQLFKRSIDCFTLRAHEAEALLHSQTGREPPQLRRYSGDTLSDTRTSLLADIPCTPTGHHGLTPIVNSLRQEGVLEKFERTSRLPTPKAYSHRMEADAN